MLFDIFSCNGQILSADKAKINLENIEYAYGFGVYETMKVRKGVLYFLPEHTERLLRSAKLIELEHLFSPQQVNKFLQSFVEYLLSLEPDLACNLKIMLIGGSNSEEANLYILPLAPLFPNRRLYKDGAITGTVEYERWRPQAKTLNMLPSYVYYSQAKEKGWYDMLLVNRRNCITEGTRTNFFTVRDKTIFTPPIAEILEGITHLTVSHIAKQNGYRVVEQNISLNSLTDYDGAFFSSTSSKIIPIKQIDDFVFQKKCTEIYNLMQIYDEFLDNCSGRFKT